MMHWIAMGLFPCKAYWVNVDIYIDTGYSQLSNIHVWYMNM